MNDKVNVLNANHSIHATFSETENKMDTVTLISVRKKICKYIEVQQTFKPRTLEKDFLHLDEAFNSGHTEAIIFAKKRSGCEFDPIKNTTKDETEAR